jgi:hypothetical protein
LDTICKVSPLERVPVVGGLGYIERVRRLQSPFTATLRAEPGNRYFPHAIAVLANGEKLGYVAPEIARAYYDPVREATVPVRCAGRRARESDHGTSGVELLLDFTGLEVAPTG